MFDFLFTKTPLVFLVQSLWRDEAYSFLLAKKNIVEIMLLTVKDFSPPFYYLLLHYWTNVFGKSEIALRSLSLVFYWATLYVVFLILNEILKINLKKSFLYLLFAAINPILVYFAFEVRMYSLFAFLTSLSFYALIKKNSRLYLVATILGLYTHYFMIFVVVGQYLVSRFKQRVALMAFAPWMVFVIINRVMSSSSFWIGKLSAMNLITFLGEVYTGYEKGLGFFGKQLIYVSLAIIAIVVYSAIKNRYEKGADRKLFHLLIIWAVGIPFFVLVISFFKPVFLPRYLIFSAVGLTVLMIYSFEKMHPYLKAFAIALIFSFSLNYQKAQIAKRTKAPMRETMMEISKLMRQEDTVYVLSELDYFTAKYYLGSEDVYIYGKSYEEIPDYIGKVLVEPDKVTTTIPVYPKKAFIINPDGTYYIQAMY